MPLTYIIESTDSSLSFILSPGEKDGFSGTQRNSDLTLQGYGVLSWGEDVNENLLRTLENHACPQKKLNDWYAPDGDYTYDPDIHPLLPKSEQDKFDPALPDVAFGPGKGINFPIHGQLWFNKTDNRMYQYSENDEWINVSGVPTVQPANPIEGDMWYDQLVPQLKIWDGLTWISVADRYVLRSGDAMHGQLSLVTTEFGSTPSVPVNDEHATNKLYVDTQITIRAVEASGDTMTGPLILHADPGPADPLLQAATKNYVDQEITNRAVEETGDTMTGDLIMNDSVIYINPSTPHFSGHNYGGMQILPIGDPLIGAAIQLTTELSTITDGSITSAPPMVEFYNNENNGLVGGTSGTWGYSRFCPRDTTIMRLEADHDDLTLGGSTQAVTTWNQTGEMAHYGVTGGNNIARTPNASVLDIDADAKALTTKEYVDAALAAYAAANPSGPTFITPVQFVSTSSTKSWTTVNVGGLVPEGTRNIILEAEWSMDRPDGGNVTARLRIRETGTSSAYILARGQASGGGDSIAGGGQGIYPMNANRQFDFYIGSAQFYGGIKARIVGYIG